MRNRNRQPQQQMVPIQDCKRNGINIAFEDLCCFGQQCHLIATDGFSFYAKAIRHVFGPACLYGQVIKTRRNDHFVKVKRRAVIGAELRLEEALRNSEDLSTVNPNS